MDITKYIVKALQMLNFTGTISSEPRQIILDLSNKTSLPALPIYFSLDNFMYDLDFYITMYNPDEYVEEWCKHYPGFTDQVSIDTLIDDAMTIHESFCELQQFLKTA